MAAKREYLHIKNLLERFKNQKTKRKRGLPPKINEDSNRLVILKPVIIPKIEKEKRRGRQERIIIILPNDETISISRELEPALGLALVSKNAKLLINQNFNLGNVEASKVLDIAKVLREEQKKVKGKRGEVELERLIKYYTEIGEREKEAITKSKRKRGV